MCIEKVQVRVKIGGHDTLPVCVSVLSSLQALLEREHLLFWLLVCSKVLMVLQRRSVQSLRLCHTLVPRNVGLLIVGCGLCAQQLNVLWHSECMLAGCMHRAMSTKPV